MKKTGISILLKDSFIYGISGIISRFIGFILLPVYSHILNQSDYGVLGMFNSSFFMLFVLMVFGLDSAAFRFYYDKEEPQSEHRLLSTWFWFQLAISVLLFALLYLFRADLSLRLFNSADERIITCLGLVILLYLGPNMLEIWFRLKRKPFYALSFALATTLINIASCYYFIVIRRDGYWGFLKGQMISFAAGTVVALIMMFRHLDPSLFSASFLRKMLRYCTPMVPAVMLTLGQTWLLNFMLKEYAGFSASGLYNMGYSIASTATLLITAFAQAWSPYAFSVMEQPDAKQIYQRVFFLYCSAMSVVALGYGLFSINILQLMTHPRYYGASPVSAILAYHYFFLNTCIIGNIGSNIMKNTKPYAAAVGISTVVTAILLYFLIPLWNKEGAALSLLLGQLFIPFFTFYASQKSYPIPYKFRQVLVPILISAGITIAFQYSTGIRTGVAVLCWKILAFLLFSGFTALYIYRQKMLKRTTL